MKMFRYRVNTYSSGFEFIEDGFCRSNGYDLAVALEQWDVVGRTKCGQWVEYYGQRKFVLDGTGKRWAYPTIEAAWDSFKRRKRKHVRILQSQLDHARSVLQFVEKIEQPPTIHPRYVGSKERFDDLHIPFQIPE